MGIQESHNGNLPAGNVHELPVICLKMYHLLGLQDALFLFYLNGLLFKALFFFFYLDVGQDVGNRLGACLIEAWGINVGACYHLRALYIGEEME